MAPAFYHYLPVRPMDSKWNEKGKTGPWLMAAGVVALLVLVCLVVPLVIFATRASSEACQDGLQAESKYRNVTHRLQDQLTRAQDGLLKVETRAHTCNQTVVTLKTSLQKQQAQNQEQQIYIQHLERDIMKLNQTLQDTVATLEQLRKEKVSSRIIVSNSASSLVGSHLAKSTMLLALVLGALLL